MAETKLRTRIIQKHAIEAVWSTSANFIPFKGEIIVYDRDENYIYERFKIGDGTTEVNLLPFVSETMVINSLNILHKNTVLSDIIDNYILNLDYSEIEFDTTELVVS